MAPPQTPTIVGPPQFFPTPAGMVVLVSFSFPASPQIPLTGHRIQRLTEQGSDGYAWPWVSIFTENRGRSATFGRAHTDTAIGDNRRYRYRAVSVNNDGVTNSVASVFVYTQPAAPRLARAQRQGDNILITWQRGTVFAETQHVLQFSTNGGGSWTNLATVAAGVTQYTHVSPSNATPYVYRIATRINAPGMVGNGTQSGWALTNSVQLIAPPNAPTITGPWTPQDADHEIRLSWNHNPVDQSAQTEYQYRWRVVGAGPSWTEQPIEFSPDQWHDQYAGFWSNDTTVEWQVRTWGSHPDPSPWSATARIVLAQAPVTTITQPTDGGLWESPTLTAQWVFFNAAGGNQTGWEAQLLDSDGTLVEARAGNGAASTTVFETLLPNNRVWTLRVRTRSQVNQWSLWEEITFTTDFPVPPTPEITVEWDCDWATASGSVINPGGVPAAIRNDIYRQDPYSGEWILVTGGVPINGEWQDFTPPAVGTICYKAVAWTAAEAAAESEPVCVSVANGTADCPAGDCVSMSAWVSGGPGFSWICRAATDLTVNTSEIGLAERVLHRFSGRAYPVEFAGVARTQVVDLSFTVDDPGIMSAADQDRFSTWDDWVRLSHLPAPLLYRDFKGNRFYCSISPLSGSDEFRGDQVALKITRVSGRGLL